MSLKEIFNAAEKSSEFLKDFKRLHKKLKSLNEDIENFQNIALKAFHKLNQENMGIVQLTGLGFEYPKVYKATKFACKSMKGRGSATGIRVIYAYYHKEDKIVFIEIYFKSDQVNENRKRIQRLIKSQ